MGRSTVMWVPSWHIVFMTEGKRKRLHNSYFTQCCGSQHIGWRKLEYWGFTPATKTGHCRFILKIWNRDIAEGDDSQEIKDHIHTAEKCRAMKSELQKIFTCTTDRCNNKHVDTVERKEQISSLYGPAVTNKEWQIFQFLEKTTVT